MHRSQRFAPQKILNKKNKVQSIILSGNKKKGDTYILNFESNHDIDDLIEQYKSTNLFEYVEADFIGFGGGKKAASQFMPNDTHFSRQYGLYNDGTFSLSPATNDADIDMDFAHRTGCYPVLMREDPPGREEFCNFPPSQHFENCMALCKFIDYL